MPMPYRVPEFACFRCRMEGLCRFGFLAKQQVWAGLRVCVSRAIFPWTCQAFRHAACSFACVCLHNCSRMLLIRLHKTPPFFQACALAQACFCCCTIERICMLQQCTLLLPALQAVRWCHRLDPMLPCQMMDSTYEYCGPPAPQAEDICMPRRDMGRT